MTLPRHTFTDSVTWMSTLLGGKVSTTDIGTFYNLAYRSVLESYQWANRIAEVVVNTVDPYSTGTVTVTQDSTTVTGAGTAWTSAMVGRYIRVSDLYIFYKISSINVGAQTMVLEQAFGSTDDGAGLTYEIFQYIYAVDQTAGDVGEILFPAREWPVYPKSLDWVNRRDPARRASGNIPVAFIPHGEDSTGDYLIEFWPRFSAAHSIRVPYYKRVDDIAGTTKPIIRGDVVEALTLQYCYSQLCTKFGDRQYPQEREYWGKQYEALLERAIIEDQTRHNLPGEIQVERPVFQDYSFMVNHDV